MNNLFRYHHGSSITRLGAVIAIALLAGQFAARAQSVGDAWTVNPLSALNSSNQDYDVTVTSDGLTIFFVSDRPGGRGGHDLWYATRSSPDSDLFSAPELVGGDINTTANEGGITIAGDGQTVYFTACGRIDSQGDCDIYTAKLNGTTVTDVRNVSEVNSTEWESHPSITTDGRTMYFASNRTGATGNAGDIDIYISRRGDDGLWSTPLNVGVPINTPGRDDAPRISGNGQRLHFVSLGHTGYGGLDIFVSTLGNNQAWEMPQNLGDQVNTSRHQQSPAPSLSGDTVYYSSLSVSQGYDLVMAVRTSSSGLDRTAERSTDRFNGRIIIAPNPVTATAAISCSGREPVASIDEITIFDSQGNQILHEKMVAQPYILKTDDLPNGTYLVRIGSITTTLVINK